MPFLSVLLNLLNLKNIIPFIIKNWKPIMIGSMAFILWYQNFSETRFLFGMETIPSLEIRLSAAEDSIKTCKEGNEELSKSINERNAEVKKWKDISLSLEKNISNLQTKLIAKRNETEKDVKNILNEKTPKSCKESIDYLRNSRKELKWED